MRFAIRSGELCGLVAQAHSSDLVMPWPAELFLLVGSTQCAAAQQKDTHWSVALDAFDFPEHPPGGDNEQPSWVVRSARD